MPLDLSSIFGGQPQRPSIGDLLQVMGAGMRDASTPGGGDNVQQAQNAIQALRMRQQQQALLAAMSSPDPATRDQALKYAVMSGAIGPEAAQFASGKPSAYQQAELDAKAAAEQQKRDREQSAITAATGDNSTGNIGSFDLPGVPVDQVNAAKTMAAADPTKIDPVFEKLLGQSADWQKLQRPNIEFINGQAVDLNSTSPGTVIPQQPTQTEAMKNAAALGLKPGTPEYDQYIREDTLPASTAPLDQENVDAQAKAIAEYRLQPMSQYAQRTPFGQEVMKQVMKLNPEYQAQNYAKSVSGYRAFSTGKQSDTVRSLNVAIAHLDTLDALGKALGNGDVQALNSVRNKFKTEFGYEAPVNFNAAKDIVANEIVKGIVGSGGGVTDREEAQKKIRDASSPQQLSGIIKTYQNLMAGQMSGYRRQYEQATFRKDFDTMLSPRTIEILGGGNAGGAPSGSKTGNPLVDKYLK